MILLIIILILSVSRADAAETAPTKGRVVDEQGHPVEYATVVLLRDGQQVVGMASDHEGRFALEAAPGDYTLLVQFVGFEPVEREIRIGETLDAGDIVLKTAATQIGNVVVEGQLIRREADRFVMEIANSPASLGKDGIELLERAPGVWIDSEKITLNGNAQPKVYINDRELRMEPGQLLAYLRSLRAEEVQKIEVIPTTGADYDADSTGGIIRITLKKRREDGLQGSLALRTNQSRLTQLYNPGGNIAYHTGKLDLNASAWGYLGSSDQLSTEKTHYTTAEKLLQARSKFTTRNYSGGATLGAIYELNDRHSIGAEFSYYHSHDTNDADSYTDMANGSITNTQSRYDNADRADGYEAMFNYIWKLDTLGSTLKILGDYLHRTTRIANDNASRITAPAPAPVYDSLYRDRTRSSYGVAAVTLALDKKFSERWTLNGGAKYTRNKMGNDARYEYLKNTEWLRNDNQSFDDTYTEHIAALYGIVSARLGRFGAVVGARGEYTHTYGRSDVEQNYFSLFPNANLSWNLTEKGDYSLVAQYARTIGRPSFWTLTPRRMQLSDYTYQIGNPRLNPSYKDNVSLTFVLKHKYTFTAGITFQSGEINQTMEADANNPEMLGILWVNYDDTKSYYVWASLPFQPTKWMQLNINATYSRRGQRIDRHAPQTFHNTVFVYTATTLSLPAKFYIDLSYSFQGRTVLGNCWVEPMHFLNAGIKKRFGERFVASFSANCLLDQEQQVGARSEGFVRTMHIQQRWNSRNYQIGFTYNFKAGKAFRQKSVEAGAAEEKGRM